MQNSLLFYIFENSQFRQPGAYNYFALTRRILLSIYEELVSKTSYIHPDMLLICIIDFLLQLK